MGLMCPPRCNIDSCVFAHKRHLGQQMQSLLLWAHIFLAHESGVEPGENSCIHAQWEQLVDPINTEHLHYNYTNMEI